MKRHAFAILIHPYINRLLSEATLQGALNQFAARLVELANSYQMLRFNLVLPAYMLQLIDPLVLARLREIQKADRLEWLTSGYTEPFISFSPLWLTAENIKLGQETFGELLGHHPVGYVPPFSNWEPSLIDTLRDCGMQFSLLSRSLLSAEERDYCGYWMTEHGGSTTVIVPTHTFDHAAAPADIAGWLDRAIAKDPLPASALRLLTIQYLLPLSTEDNTDPFEWLNAVVRVMDSLLVNYQILRLSEFPSLTFPIGLQYIAPSLVFRRTDEEKASNFLNYLHTFDQVSVLQRKMLDAADHLRSLGINKKTLPLLRQLFSAQDINRYLPGKTSGFPLPADRHWCYSRLIAIENQLRAIERIRGCQLRITDFLRNGTKSIILSNSELKAYIDHKNGGQIFELDIRQRQLNICAGFNPTNYPAPRVLSAGLSHTAFIDYFLPADSSYESFVAAGMQQCGDFITGQFQYKVKKHDKGVKAILSRQGSVSLEDKSYPVYMEKVFGLDEEGAAISFAYQLANPVLTAFAFRFGVSLTFTLPGLLTGQAYLTAHRKAYRTIANAPLCLHGLTQWVLHDCVGGIALHFRLQKPLDLWCFPTRGNSEAGGAITLLLTAPVSLPESAVWSLIGKMSCKKIRIRAGGNDAV